MLPSNVEHLWRTYVEAEGRELRKLSLASLSHFIEALLGLPEHVWHEWAFRLAQQSVDNFDLNLSHPSFLDTEGKVRIRVRNPLFQRVLFPALYEGYVSGRDGCARWLAGFEQQLYQSKDCLSQLPTGQLIQEYLLRQALALDPNDSLARRKLIDELARQFSFAIHELPAGVLGVENASDCERLVAAIVEFDTLVKMEGLSEQYSELTDFCRFHFSDYAEYLKDSTSFDSYEDYLRKINAPPDRFRW